MGDKQKTVSEQTTIEHKCPEGGENAWIVNCARCDYQMYLAEKLTPQVVYQCDHCGYVGF